MSVDTTASDFNIRAAQFQEQLDKGTPTIVFDVRNRVAFATTRIDGSQHVTVMNAPFSEIMSEPGADNFTATLKSYTERHMEGKLTEDAVIVGVCASGVSSVPVVQGLRSLGYNALNLEGGMAAWNNYYDIRMVSVGEKTTIYQVSRPARGCLSYVAASGDEAIVIDPLRHADVYTDIAQQHNLRIVRVIDTHGHADHISGGPALAKALHVPYSLHPYDAIHPMDVLPATIEYEPMHDGHLFRFGPEDSTADGQSVLRVMHVPGHTLGSVALLFDESHAFVGDTIFVQSIARPDLGGRGDTWAPIHYESLQRLIRLPDDTVFWPGHYSSPEEADEQGLFARPVHVLRATNAGLAPLQRSRDDFIRYILDNLPEFPPQYIDMKRVNIGLLQPDERTAATLETGRNICALSEGSLDF